MRLETSLPHERPAIRASMCQTWTSGSCQSFVLKGSIPLQPTLWSSNSSTERTGSCTLRSQVDSLWQTGHLRRSLGATGVSSMRSLRFMPVSKISFGSVVAGSEGTMARVTASPQLEW